jgi:hypothetical protein
MDTDGKRDFTGKVAFVTGAANGIGRAAGLALPGKARAWSWLTFPNRTIETPLA